MGMGGAFVGIADDATALFHNPGGLFQLKRPEFIIAPAYLVQKSGDSLYGYLAYVQPVPAAGHFGIGLLSRGVNLKYRYRENTLGISYCRALNSYLSLGLTLKVCSKEYPDNTETISAISDSRFFTGRFPQHLGADLAFFLSSIPGMERLSLGVALTDMGAGVMGFRLGAGYRFRELAIFNEVLGSSDAFIRADGDFKINFGAEAWFKQTEGLKRVLKDNLLGIRTGMKFGNNGDFSFVFGAGLKSNNIEKTDWRLDCAVAIPYHSSVEFPTTGVWLSLSCLLGDAYRWEKEERARREIERRAKEEMEKLLNEKLRLEEEKARLEKEKQRLEEEKRRLEEEQRKALDELKKLKGITVREEKEKIIIVATETAIRFASGSAELIEESYRALDEIARALKAYPGSKVLVEGHTDNVPIGPKLKSKYRTNLELSLARAESVAAYFVSQGISQERLVKKGYGEERPVAPNTTEEGRAKNRRVEITIQK